MSGASFKVDPLFLLAIRPFKPGLFFKSMSSSSLELVSGQATVNLGRWIAENLSDSVSKSESSTGLSGAPSPSSKQNWLISVSRVRRDEADSSLGAATC